MASDERPTPNDPDRGMRGTGPVQRILVGLNRVGIDGLASAMREAAQSELDDEDRLDLIYRSLAARNYIPDSAEDLYRRAFWREFVRSQNGDPRPFFSEIDVEIRAEPGGDRDQLVDVLTDVLAEFELKPGLAFSAPHPDQAGPEVLIHDECVHKGAASRRDLKIAINRQITDW